MKNARTIILFGFLLRMLYASYIGYLGGADGLEMDAQGFYMRMVLIARSGVFEPMGVGEGIVLNSVGTLMGIFSDSAFFGCFLSCLIWLSSGLLFVHILNNIDISDNTKRIFAALYAFWPTAIAYTVPTLREPYQLLFVNLALFSALSLIRNRQPLFWPFLIIGLLGAGWLHGALAAYGFIMLMLTILFYSIISEADLPMGRILIATTIAVFIGYIGVTEFSAISYNIDGGVLESAQTYQGYGTDLYGRTNYKSGSEVTTGFASIIFIVIGVFQYLFEPMPFRISAIVDLILFAENSIRFVLILMTIIELRKSEKHSQRRLLAFLFCAYISQEATWSLGTVNWGTASRHHVPAMGLLLAMGAQAWVLRKNRLSITARSQMARNV
jgi:hypothetical protein